MADPNVLTLGNLFAEYHRLRGTQAFLDGIILAVISIGIQILLLSILAPIVLYAINRIRTRGIRFEADFYLFQIFHRITRFFLDMAGIKDIMPMLMEEMDRDPKFRVGSHYVYGNLDNILFVLKKVSAGRIEYTKAIEARTLEDFQRYHKICERCLEEIDRLTAMLVMVPDVQTDFFSMRRLVFGLRDLMERIVEDIDASKTDPIRRNLHMGDAQELTRQVIEMIDLIFATRRGLIDSTLKYLQWLGVGVRIALLPYVIARHWLTLCVCRLRGKPYRHFLYPSYSQDRLKEWREEVGLSPEAAATALGVKVSIYRHYELGYREPDRSLWVTIERLRKKVAAKNTADRPSPPAV